VAARLAPHVGGDAVRAARLHTDDNADLFAAAHDAHAVTLGDHIYFARGEYAPGTEAGDDLLVHELTHVAQAQRGELFRAAAKGLGSGSVLDPAEAEAELRAKLAVIELHAPAAPAPQPAAPAPQPAAPKGQPTSDGERQARITAQQQRLASAKQDPTPDTPAKRPAPLSAQAPVAHPGPELAPPPKVAAAKGDAYEEALEAPPSKQATELWGNVGAKATTEAQANQAAFSAGLPPMPIQLEGAEAKAAKGGGAAAQQPKPKVPAGPVPPSAKPPATPQPKPVNVAANSTRKLQELPDKSRMQAEGKKAMAALPTTSPAIKTDPGTPPVADLAGQADPARTNAEQQAAFSDGAKALDAEKKKVLAGKGAANVQPKQLDEKLEVPRVEASGPMPELPKPEGMDKFKKWNLPTEVQGSFDAVAKPKMDASLAQAKSKMNEAEAKRDADREKAVTDAQDKVKKAHADADAKQQAKIAESRTRITNKQAETLSKQQAEVQKLDKQSGDKKQAALAKIDNRIKSDQAKVDADYDAAQKKAEAEKRKGEEEAARKKKEAQEKAEKEKSWWDRVADAVCDAIQAIADAIDKALEAVGKAIGGILDAVKNAACAVIDAARDFVCSALEEFGSWLKSAVTALLGSVFPELAAALNKFIDNAVNAAKTAVNAIADGLKKAVTAYLDGLKAAVNATLAAFRAGVQAAATFAKALVTGDWAMVAKMALEAVLRLLGIDPEAFYALVGKAEATITKILDDPGAFVGHLVDAVKLGFKQFGANFLTHLKDGVLQWLFGTFAEAGIRMPAQFDIAGVFDLTCQVLGLTWPRLRGKVVKVIGEKNTERLEFVAGYIEALITGGFAGLWEKVQQDLSSLWDTVIGGAKQWLMEKLVQQAIIKIATMWNPAGAIIQLIQTAWNVYCWVKENAQRIFGLIQAVVDSVSNIANGNIAGAANYIESSLAKLVPIAISLFANLLGLGGIAGKIKSIIEKIQLQVDKAIDALIDRVLKAFKGGDKKKDKDKKKGEGEDKKKGEGEDKKKGEGEEDEGDDRDKDDKTSKSEKDKKNQEILAKASRELTPKIHAELKKRPNKLVFRAKLSAWRVQYRLTSLKMRESGDKFDVEAKVNPSTTLAGGYEYETADLLKMLKRIGERLLRENPDALKSAADRAEELEIDPKKAKANRAYAPVSAEERLAIAADQRNAQAEREQRDRTLIHHGVAEDGGAIRSVHEKPGGNGVRKQGDELVRSVNEDGSASNAKRYTQLANILEGRGISPRDLGRAMYAMSHGFDAPPTMKGSEKELGELMGLFFGTEASRDSTNAVFSMMAIEKLQSGGKDVTISSVFSSLPAQMKGHVKATETLDADLSNQERPKTRSKPKQQRDLDTLVTRQLEQLKSWFQAQLDGGTAPLTASLADLERFVETMVQRFVRNYSR
jgi:hypothetical protein